MSGSMSSVLTGWVRYNRGMDRRGEDKSLNGKAVAAAIESCRQRQSACVLSDPLEYAEFDGATSWCHDGIDKPAEADTFTRPKQGGGWRVEVVPDFSTSVELQLIAERVGEREPPQSYESWWDSVSMWIRHALVQGMAVIVADVENYFGSIPTSGIKRALHSLDLDEGSIETTLCAIHEVNSAPDFDGATRTGLPVVQDELVWLIADAVLRPVDQRLSLEPIVARHLRWVDDFFVAVDSNDVDQALISLSAALDAEGLRLNGTKTRVFGSVEDFEQQTMTYEHRLVSNLTMAGSRGNLSALQQCAFGRLVEGERSATPEQARFWKRMYALAQRLRSPALVPAAIDDLMRFPTAAGQISSYLRSLNWPCGTEAQSAEWVAHAPTDSQAIVMLRALLSSEEPLARAAVTALKEVSESAVIRIHPYTRVLLHACLMLRQQNEDCGAAEWLLPLSRTTRSPLARRIAIEVLWLMPEKRAQLAELIRKDSSQTVRGLAMLPAIAGHAAGKGAFGGEEQTVDTSWDGVGSELKSTWMQAAS